MNPVIPETYATAAGFTGVFSLLVCGIYICIGIFALVMIVLWIWMLIDLIQRQPNQFGDKSDDNTKLLWLIILLLTNWLGAVIYYFMIYRKYPRS